MEGSLPTPDIAAERPETKADAHPPFLTRELRAALKVMAFVWGVVAFTVGVVALEGTVVGPRRDVLQVMAIGGAFASIAGGLVSLVSAPVLALVSVVRSARSAEPFSSRTFARFLVSIAIAFGGLVTAFFSSFAFARGRQIRVRGKLVLPPVSESEGWLIRAAADNDVARWPESETDRRALADAWRENGKTEHASVAAFSRLTLDLMTLGAPSALVVASQRDGLDESRHTELCFSLAREIDGRARSPVAFPKADAARSLPSSRSFALASLAVTSLVDGALNEGVSARVIARLAKSCDVPRIREVLREIAADEGRHAAHGWDVVEWCVAEGGSPVLAALLAAASAIREVPTPSSDPRTREGAWEQVGVPSFATEQEEYSRTRRDVLARVERLRAQGAAAASFSAAG